MIEYLWELHEDWSYFTNRPEDIADLAVKEGLSGRSFFKSRLTPRRAMIAALSYPRYPAEPGARQGPS